MRIGRRSCFAVFVFGDAVGLDTGGILHNAPMVVSVIKDESHVKFTGETCDEFGQGVQIPDLRYLMIV